MSDNDRELVFDNFVSVEVNKGQISYLFPHGYDIEFNDPFAMSLNDFIGNKEEQIELFKEKFSQQLAILEKITKKPIEPTFIISGHYT